MPNPSQTRNSGATAIFGTSWRNMSGGYTTCFASGDNAMTSPTGIAVTIVNPKPQTISVTVTIELLQSCGYSSTSREKTSPGPGITYAGISKRRTTAAQ